MPSAPPGPADRPRRSDARRNFRMIIESAGRLLASDPRASMQDVAEAAGVHRATVHRHFATRDHLIHAVREQAVEEFAALVKDPALHELGPREGLERLTRGTLELGDRQRIYRVTAMFDDVSDARAEELTIPMARLMAAAQAAGAARDDVAPRMLGAAWSGLILVALPQIAAGLTLDDATEFVLRLLRAPG